MATSVPVKKTQARTVHMSDDFQLFGTDPIRQGPFFFGTVPEKHLEVLFLNRLYLLRALRGNS
jgi:hypothetical protein